MRPFVFVNMAMTADGKITSSAREYPRFTSRRDKATMDRLRRDADAILVGAGTLRADNPPLQPSEGGPLLQVMVSGSLELDPELRFFSDVDASSSIVATVEEVSAARREALAELAEIWTVGRDRVDLPELLRRLREERGVERLLCEGGAELNWQLLRHDLLDELYLTVAPALLGGGEAPTPIEGPGLPMADQVRLRLVSVERHEDELYCRYAVARAS